MKKLLHENAAFRVYYLLDEDSGVQTILKILKNEFAGADEVVQLNHELEITQALPIPCVRKAIRREKIDNCEALVLEYFDGESLYDLFVKRRQTLPQFMMAAIKISGAIGELHQHNIERRRRKLLGGRTLIDSAHLSFYVDRNRFRFGKVFDNG